MSEIRKYFVAPPGHRLVEFDYAQLEVRVLAALSKDKTLITDLNTGLDMHCMSAALMFGNTYDYVKSQCDAGTQQWIDRRKKAKAVSFLIQYGGGYKLAAEQTGVPEQTVKNYMDAYSKRYHRVVDFQEEVKAEVNRTRLSSTRTTAMGNPAGIGYWRAPTGRLFGFVETDSPRYLKSTTSFMPTQTKNYPSQGTGWDIVAVMLAHLMDICYNTHPDVKFVNTVHDSLMFYVPEEDIHSFIPLAEKELAQVPAVAKKVWGWDINVDFPVDCKVGYNWFSMNSLDKVTEEDYQLAIN